jgi:hypothetical protein
MHTPKMTPAIYEAGVDLKLMEFQGMTLAAMESRSQRITIQHIRNGSWYVMDGNMNALADYKTEGEPIIFTFGLHNATPSATAEEALTMLTAYLNQPVNPYAWLRDNAGN